MIGGDDLDLAAQDRAAEILWRHLRGGLAAGAGNVGVETGHIEDAAKLEGRLALRESARCRQTQNPGENAGKDSLHFNLPVRMPPCPAVLIISFAAILPPAIAIGQP